MSDRTLEVWCFDELAGLLSEVVGGLSFRYDAQWVAAGRPTLSQALPTDGSFDDRATYAFFDGLLPEGRVRDLFGRQLGISASNDFSMLDQIGGDCAGAVSLYPPDATLSERPASIQWLDDQALAELVRELPARPFFAEPDGTLRLSLAGAQDKIPVVVQGGRVGLAVGAQPSTHILKTPIPGLPATVLNEALWSRVGSRLDVDCAVSIPNRVADAEMLLVERYDRARLDGDALVRLHQEDFCQALAVPSINKYQREGGPGLTQCFELLRSAVATPARELPRLLDHWAFSFIAGNHDAHGKNYSLLYSPEGTRLAPVYDVLNTASYRKIARLDNNMAMSVGGEYRPDHVERRHLDRMLGDAGLGAAAARRRLSGLARRAPDAIVAARTELVAEYWDDKHLDTVVEISLRRAARLAEAAGGRM